MTEPTITVQTLRGSTAQAAPPPGLPPLVTALWWEAKGDWSRAHEIAQDVHGRAGAWVHAYLHRREGDEGNAGYWYRQAGRPHCTLPLDQEWDEIAAALLAER